MGTAIEVETQQGRYQRQKKHSAAFVRGRGQTSQIEVIIYYNSKRFNIPGSKCIQEKSDTTIEQGYDGAARSEMVYKTTNESLDARLDHFHQRSSR